MLDELSGLIRNFVSKDLYFFFPFLSPIQSQIHKKKTIWAGQSMLTEHVRKLPFVTLK